jgi:RHS repeat-associated protein
MVSGGATQWTAHDGPAAMLGFDGAAATTARDLADDAEAIVDHVDYSAYGQILAESAPAVGDRWKFTGREWDAAVGLQYNRARYYDPAAGRWLSQDPIGFAAGDANLYRYVGNRATNATDPSGLQYVDPPDLGAINRPGSGTLTPGLLGTSGSNSSETQQQGYGQVDDYIEELGREMAGTVVEVVATEVGVTVVVRYGPGLFRTVTQRFTPGQRRLPPGTYPGPAKCMVPPGKIPPRRTIADVLRDGGRSIGLPGKNPGVRTLKSVGEMESLFNELSAGGTVVPSGTYPGRVVKMPDGSVIRIRPGSKSGGPTIDITGPNGKPLKVHIDPWPPC